MHKQLLILLICIKIYYLGWFEYILKIFLIFILNLYIFTLNIILNTNQYLKLFKKFK